MRYQLYKLFNSSVRLLPAPVLHQLLNALHRHPDIADQVGYQVYPQSFYNPFPEPKEIDCVKLREKRTLPGITMEVAGSLALMKTLSGYSQELAKFNAARPNHLKYWDMTYMPGDTATLYTMLRHLKPQKYIEVGCGYSSRTSSAALKRNSDEGHGCECIYIEPFPPAHLSEVKLPGEFIQKKVQQVPVETFLRLESGDVLFLDTSHVIKSQNDVEYEFLRILPALKPGVLVHVHDIFTPYDYPEDLLVGTGPNRGGNNEQYALECLLSGGDWEVILPVYLLWKEHRSLFDPLISSEAAKPPAAFWIRKRR
jgi:Methyltransferase domain